MWHPRIPEESLEMRRNASGKNSAGDPYRLTVGSRLKWAFLMAALSIIWMEIWQLNLT